MIKECLTIYEKKCVDVEAEHTPIIKVDSSRLQTSIHYIIDIIELEPEFGLSSKIIRTAIGPLSKHYFTRLEAKWTDLPMKIGTIVYLSARYSIFTLEPYFKSKLYGVISDREGTIVLYPHFLIKSSTLSFSHPCLRQGFLREMIARPGLSSSYICSLICKESIVRYIKSNCKRDIKAIINETMSHHSIEIALLGETDSSIRSQVNNRLLLLVKQHHLSPPLSLTNIDESTFYQTRMFPVSYLDKAWNTNVIRSFKHGIVSKVDLIVKDEDEELLSFDIYRKTLSQSKVENSHVLSASCHNVLLKDFYPQIASDYSYLMYYETDTRFVLKPRRDDITQMLYNRNCIAYSICEKSKIPSFFSEECEYCMMKTECQLYERFTKTESDRFEVSSEYQFYNDYYQEIAEEASNSMKSCLKLITTPIEYRKNQGVCLNSIPVSEIESKHDYFIVSFDINDPQSIFKSNFDSQSRVIITKNGTLPILSFGFIQSISSKKVILKTKELSFSVGDVVSLDFLNFGKIYKMKNSSLHDLLNYSSNQKLKSILIKKEPPHFETGIFPIIPTLNNKQNEAYGMCLLSSEYCLINSPPGTGKYRLFLKLLDNLINDRKRILIIAQYYEVIEQIIQKIQNFPILACIPSEKIKECYHKYCEDQCFGGMSSSEVLASIESYQIIIANSMRHSIVVTNLHFDVCFVFNSSNTHILQVLPIISQCTQLILFGDRSTAEKNNLFSFLESFYPFSCVSLIEAYDCDPKIIDYSRLIFGSERFTEDAPILFDPTSFLLKYSNQSMISKILSYKSPIVFINTLNQEIGFKIALLSSMVYPSTVIITSKPNIPKIKEIHHSYTNNGEFAQYAKNIAIKSPQSMRYNRYINIILIDHDPLSLVLALGATKRKLILVSSIKSVSISPMWSTLINQLPRESLFKEPDLSFF